MSGVDVEVISRLLGKHTKDVTYCEGLITKAAQKRLACISNMHFVIANNRLFKPSSFFFKCSSGSV